MVALTALATPVLVSLGHGQERENDGQRSQLLGAMRSLAEETKVDFVEQDKGSRVELIKNPVFRYADQPRRFVDATLWAWTHKGRPVAFQKIEAMEFGEAASASRFWQFCFASVSTDLVAAQWPGERRFKSTEPGVVFRSIAGAPAVAGGNAARKRQARELVRKFSARILTDPKNNFTQEMRLLTTALFDYDDPETKEYRGAVFGLSTNGTNPDVLLVLEVGGEKGKPAWHFAPARMTTGGVTLRFGETKVWECESADAAEVALKTWTFFVTPRGRLRDEAGRKP
jgi:hypothetical protein